MAAMPPIRLPKPTRHLKTRATVFAVASTPLATSGASFTATIITVGIWGAFVFGWPAR